MSKYDSDVDVKPIRQRSDEYDMEGLLSSNSSNSGFKGAWTEPVTYQSAHAETSRKSRDGSWITSVNVVESVSPVDSLSLGRPDAMSVEDKEVLEMKNESLPAIAEGVRTLGNLYANMHAWMVEHNDTCANILAQQTHLLDLCDATNNVDDSPNQSSDVPAFQPSHSFLDLAQCAPKGLALPQYMVAKHPNLRLSESGESISEVAHKDTFHAPHHAFRAAHEAHEPHSPRESPPALDRDNSGGSSKHSGGHAQMFDPAHEDGHSSGHSPGVTSTSNHSGFHSGGHSGSGDHLKVVPSGEVIDNVVPISPRSLHGLRANTNDEVHKSGSDGGVGNRSLGSHRAGSMQSMGSMTSAEGEKKTTFGVMATLATKVTTSLQAIAPRSSRRISALVATPASEPIKSSTYIKRRSVGSLGLNELQEKKLQGDQAMRRSKHGGQTNNPLFLLLERVVDHPGFEVMSAIVILSHSALVGAYVQYTALLSSDGHVGFTVGNVMLTTIFFVEVFAKLGAERSHFFKGSEGYWNVFDMTLLMLVFLELGIGLFCVESCQAQMKTVLKSAEMIRTFRVMRIFKFLRLSSTLSMILTKVYGSIKALLWVMALFIMLLYVLSVCLTQGFNSSMDGRQHNENDMTEMEKDVQEHFGGVGTGMYTIFASFTGGVMWDLTKKRLDYIGWWYSMLFVVFMAFSTFFMLNIITGIFVDNAVRADKDLSKITEDKFQAARLFDVLHPDGAQVITYQEFIDFAKDPVLQCYLHEMNIEQVDASTLFYLLDEEGNGSVAVDDLISGLINLKAPATCLDSKVMMFEMQGNWNWLRKALIRLEKKVIDNHTHRADRKTHGGTPFGSNNPHGHDPKSHIGEPGHIGFASAVDVKQTSSQSGRPEMVPMVSVSTSSDQLSPRYVSHPHAPQGREAAGKNSEPSFGVVPAMEG